MGLYEQKVNKHIQDETKLRVFVLNFIVFAYQGFIKLIFYTLREHYTCMCCLCFINP